METKDCKNCRSEGKKLFLKGDRCNSQKCAMTKRAFNPGQRGFSSHKKISEYGRQLGEKQLAKQTYGYSEEQLRRIFTAAQRMTGDVGYNLMSLFETRIDNVLFQAGFFPSRAAARQAVVHGKVTVNGIKVKTPSYTADKSDKIVLKSNSEEKHKEQIPNWLKVDNKKKTVEVLHRPTEEDIVTDIEIGLVVESLNR